MAILNELNSIMQLSVPYEEYFSIMDLSPDEIKKRIEFSENIEEIMLYIFFLLSTMRDYGYINKNYAVSELKRQYMDVAEQYVTIDKYMEEYIDRFSEEIIDTTLRHESDEWYLSDDRSVLIAENESNSIFNHSDYASAIKSGKTRKRWITERDDRVRKTHAEVNGITIPIEEPFVVGDSLLLYPKDETFLPNPEQTVNCRCTIRYF